MRKKSLIRRLIPWIFAAAVIGGIVYLGFLIYGQKEAVNENPPVVAYFDEDVKSYKMENDDLLFELDAATTQFVVTEKGGEGRKWYSNPPDADSDTVTYAGTEARDALHATMFVTYTPTNGTDPTQINNFTYCISKQAYTIDQLEDGGIRVNYSVGNVEQQFRIPYVITLERYDQYKEKFYALEGGKKTFDQKLIKKYVKVTPESLAKRDDRDTLLEMYPALQDTTMYVLNKNDNKNKRELQKYFADAGYSEEEFAEDQALIAKKPDSKGPVFNVSIVYRLEGKDLVVEVPYDRIRYKLDYPITYVSPLPMFNAAGADQEGFLMIPEGGGAIIRYNNGKLSQSEYTANLYGWDYGEERKEAKVETKNAFSVFGATSGEASYICLIEGASSYASINADIGGPGHRNGFNTVYARYNVIHAAEYNVSNKTGKRVYVYEQEVPKDCIRQRYRFLDSADYTDMANAYGDYLREKVPELSTAKASEESPVNIELIGAIDKKVVKLGMPVDSVVATTTFEQAQKILDELSGEQIGNLSIRMTGWANGGVRQKVLTGVHVLNELGGESAMKSLIAEARLRDVALYFDGINCFAYDSGATDGFVAFSNAARYATRDLIHLYPYSIVTYDKAEWMDDYYVVKPAYAKQNATNLINALKDRNAYGIAFRDIGSLLSADYNPREIRTREEVKQLNIETMKEAAAAGMKVIIKEGNDYAVPYADLITDMNLTGEAYAIIDERIPFYQIALHGMKDFTGKPINLSGDYVTMLLECVEYGTGLHFTFMAEDTRILRDSVYSEYTASGYNFWKQQVIPMITRYQKEMKGLNQQKITGHERISEEVAVTTYEDGTKVYVNYGSYDYSEGGISVPARDYRVTNGKGASK